jgi:hypothetical protein
MLPNPRHYPTPVPGDQHHPAEYLKHPRFLEIRAQVFNRPAGKYERAEMRPTVEPHRSPQRIRAAR